MSLLIDVIELIFKLLGGGVVIVFAFSKWLGKVWAERIARIENARLQIEIERSKRYDEFQFRIYNEFWAILCDLKFSGDALWREASTRNLQKFANNLKKANEQVMKSSLLIDIEDYHSLRNLISNFENFHFGKRRLIDLRSSISESGINNTEISDTINNNQSFFTMYNSLLENLEPKLRQRIQGSFK